MLLFYWAWSKVLQKNAWNAIKDLNLLHPKQKRLRLLFRDIFVSLTASRLNVIRGNNKNRSSLQNKSCHRVSCGVTVRMQKLHTRWRRPRTVRYRRHLQGSVSLQVLMTVTHLWQLWTSGPSAAAERRREAPFWSDWQEDDRSASSSWREMKR